MKPVPNPAVEPHRITRGPKASDARYGNNGAFLIPGPDHGKLLTVIASDGAGWEHVSVSTRSRIPTWDEMCLVKDLFWGENETVVQYHPAKAHYVNNHPYVLHLWRPLGSEFPLPPDRLVGIKALGQLMPG